jgi:hypothetical protein
MIVRVGSALAFVALAALTSLGGCKEGEGERCQVDNDCASGLICNQAQQLCTAPGTSGGIDATVPDAPPIDAPAIDAGSGPG